MLSMQLWNGSDFLHHTADQASHKIIGLIQGQVDNIMDSFTYLMQGVYAMSGGNEYVYCEVCGLQVYLPVLCIFASTTHY